jgi:hypothetical protein
MLLAAFFSVVAAIKSLFFVMENVPSVLARPELKALLASRAPGYAVCDGILNAACYGLPTGATVVSRDARRDGMAVDRLSRVRTTHSSSSATTTSCHSPSSWP